jgi:integrase
VEEIDLDAAVWNVPGSRMKAGVDHAVPLSHRAVEILRGLKSARAEFIFTNGGGKPLSDMAMRELLKGMDSNGSTPHGFRATFNTWAKNQTNYDPETRNAALAHTEEKLEQAYTRDKNWLMFDKRRRLMTDWARYLESSATSSGNVVNMRG